MAYTIRADFQRFRRELDAGGVGGGVFPGVRGSYDDGQLKIMLDVILAVDSLVLSGVDSNRRYKVLVIGSSAPGFSCAGKSYRIIGKMLPNSDVDLYDPNNENYCLKEGDTVYRYFKSVFDYDCETVYDLVLDDSWLEGVPRSQRDPNGWVYDADHYSVKKFPAEVREGNRIYYQLFSTYGREERCVSRDVVYDYRPLDKLGKCTACEELRFLLKGNYDIYDEFMDMHKRNCITGKIRTDVHEGFFEADDWVGFVPPSDDKDLGLKQFLWDNMERPVVTLKVEDLATSDVIVSSVEKVPIGLVKDISLLIIEHKGLWFTNKPDKMERKFRLRRVVDMIPTLDYEFVGKESFNFMAENVRTRLVRDKRRAKNVFPIKKGQIDAGKKVRKKR